MTDHPRRTVQIVIPGQAAKVGRVRWTLAHTPQAGNGEANGAGRPPEPGPEPKPPQ